MATAFCPLLQELFLLKAATNKRKRPRQLSLGTLVRTVSPRSLVTRTVTRFHLPKLYKIEQLWSRKTGSVLACNSEPRSWVSAEISTFDPHDRVTVTFNPTPLSAHFKPDPRGSGSCLFAVSPGCALRLFSGALPDFVTEIRNLLGDVGSSFFTSGGCD